MKLASQQQARIVIEAVLEHKTKAFESQHWLLGMVRLGEVFVVAQQRKLEGKLVDLPTGYRFFDRDEAFAYYDERAKEMVEFALDAMFEDAEEEAIV